MSAGPRDSAPGRSVSSFWAREARDSSDSHGLADGCATSAIASLGIAAAWTAVTCKPCRVYTLSSVSIWYLMMRGGDRKRFIACGGQHGRADGRVGERCRIRRGAESEEVTCKEESTVARCMRDATYAGCVQPPGGRLCARSPQTPLGREHWHASTLRV